MNSIKVIFFGLLTLIGKVVLGQDPSPSQYYFNQTYFNPALAGIHGGTNFGLTYRRLWPNMPSKFETMYFSFDTDISAVKGLGGFGFTLYKDVEGAGFQTTLGGSLELNSRIRVMRTSFIQAGLSVSVYSKSLDWSKFTFGDQLDPYYGVLSTPSAFIRPIDQSHIFPDISVGIVYAYGRGPKRHIFKKNYNAKFGISLQHFNEPTTSFLDQKSKLPMKMVIHGNANIAVSRNADMIFSPCLIFEYQEAFRWSNFDMKTLYVGYNVLWNNFFMGNWYRFYSNIDALTICVGFITGSNNKNTNKFKLYYSYDMTLSNLSIRSTGGSHEIGLAYYFSDKLFSSSGKSRSRPLSFPDSY